MHINKNKIDIHKLVPSWESCEKLKDHLTFRPRHYWKKKNTDQVLHDKQHIVNELEEDGSTYLPAPTLGELWLALKKRLNWSDPGYDPSIDYEMAPKEERKYRIGFRLNKDKSNYVCKYADREEANNFGVGYFKEGNLVLLENSARGSRLIDRLADLVDKTNEEGVDILAPVNFEDVIPEDFINSPLY